jgi:hypothetical protein
VEIKKVSKRIDELSVENMSIDRKIWTTQDPVKLANLKEYQIDLIEELTDLRDKYGDLLDDRRAEKYKLEKYKIRNVFFGANRDIILKTTKNPRHTDANLQEIMGINPRTPAYKNHCLFQKRRLPRPYNQPPPPVNVNYPDP